MNPVSRPDPSKRTNTYNALSSCPDVEDAFVPIYEAARQYTMTSLERMYGLYKAVEYVVAHNIPGDFVECGVWKGGSTMVAAMTFLAMGDTSRRIWMYDTFEGMPAPGADDIQYDNITADERARRQKIVDWSTIANAGTEEVAANLARTGYPRERLEFVKGKVEETIPSRMPESISLLRLDTDWYDSTRHEMEHLFPLLNPGGVLLIDDYGHWKGSKKAVDEYLTAHGIRMLLNRIDYTARIGVKPITLSVNATVVRPHHQRLVDAAEGSMS